MIGGQDAIRPPWDGGIGLAPYANDNGCLCMDETVKMRVFLGKMG